MADAPVQTPPPREFVSASISDADSKTIRELADHLNANSYDYNSHVQLINLLHRGFVAHVDAPADDAMIPSRPSDYTLLNDLRTARGAMDSRFSVGEDIWRDWINDESTLAHTSEERQAVMELCQKSVTEEPYSVVLWSLYGEWVWQTYAVANGLSVGDEDTWTEEDKMICREIFTRDMVIDVWGKAVDATRWRIDESHVIWSRYLELIMQDLPERPAAQTVEEIQALFMARLQIPHTAWDDTSQSFWPFISKHKASGWEEIMSAANEMAGPAKKEYDLRQQHESELKTALRSNDNVALYNALNSYLSWESKRGSGKKRGPFDTELRCALYERALLRLPTMTEWWLDYVDFLTSLRVEGMTLLPLLERATRHCPWSGELWARRLLRVELELGTYNEVEAVKHKATNSGLLPTGGIEELLIVYASWCSYLRRRAFAPTAPDDDVDMAEMAISDVLSDYQHGWRKMHGEHATSKPGWRIEKVFIKFLTQAGRVNEARDFWRSLIPAQGHGYDFWQQYYEWEIFVWGAERSIGHLREQTARSSPQRASDVLRDAMAQRNLDWPEKIHELYAHHFETHEMAAALQQAQLDLRVAQKYLKIRREKEAREAAAAQEGQKAEAAASAEASAALKRKRNEEPTVHDENSTKRNRIEEPVPSVEEGISSTATPAQFKRDREHNTITVKNLSADVEEKKVRQLFSDCGKVLAINLLVDQTGECATATVEFETHEDVLSASTKDHKQLDGREIRVQTGTLSTLYVTNYPPSYAEDEIRDIFKSYGTVVSIRFPSLKFNQRRRFCYVQFLTAEEAHNATALNDKVIDSQHKLVALISDPEAKKDRKGATAEGREVYIGNVEHGATEEEIKAFFGEVGSIQNIRMIKAANGKFTGTVFIVYATADEADAALKLNGKFLHERVLKVSIATDKSTRDAANKKSGTSKVFDTARSTSPAATSQNGADGANAGSPGPPDGNASNTAYTKHERTVALLNLPETVNDTRVHDFFAKFGPIRKLTIRRDKSGAMIEFVNMEDAGKVGMGADARALGPDCRIGGVPELLARKSGGRPDGSSAPSGSKPLRPAQVARPAQRGGRGGRKIGVGFQSTHSGDSNVDGAKKSNDDFRSMFLQSSGATKDGATEAKQDA